MGKPYPSAEDTRRWLAGLPKKSLAVKAIILSDKGNVLLVKPNYKETWQFPGGGVETHEEPREALLRELREELHFEADNSDFTLIDTVFRREHDNCILMYKYQEHLRESEALKYQQEELEGYKFEKLELVGPQLSDYYMDFWETFKAAI